MAINAVLFDFAGTLFRLEQDVSSWTEDSGAPLEDARREELVRRMTTSSGELAGLTGEYLEAWQQRDLDPELHRKAYLEVLRLSGIAGQANASRIYESAIDAASWVPYPDTAEVLKRVSGAGQAVGVLSNIAFDVRPTFVERGLDAYIDAFVLSFEHGVVKPDPAIFELALHRLGVPAAQTLMVGDSPEADGAARELGCAFALVEPTAIDQRPDGLCTALREHGVL